MGWGTGTLGCSAACRFDPSGCGHVGTCGNGVFEGLEACDGEDFSGDTRLDHGYGGGSLACTQGCTVDTSGCALALCGNGIVEDLEACNDSGNVPGDGCSADCSVEAGWDRWTAGGGDPRRWAL